MVIIFDDYDDDDKYMLDFFSILNDGNYLFTQLMFRYYKHIHKHKDHMIDKNIHIESFNIIYSCESGSETKKKQKFDAYEFVDVFCSSHKITVSTFFHFLHYVCV